MITENNNSIKRAKVLGYPVDLVDLNQSLDIIAKAFKENRQNHIVTLNPEMIIQSEKNPELGNSINSADLIIPDGVGILFALKRQGVNINKPVPGIELSQQCIEYCSKNGYSVAFFGAKKEIINEMLAIFSEKYPDLNVIYSRDGYYDLDEEESIVKEIVNLKPDLLLVALGVPMQELWISKYKIFFPQTTIIGVGGSFDVWSGRVKRAPKFFRDLKLEWFYRLIKEPSRFKRQLSTLPYFVFKVMTEK